MTKSRLIRLIRSWLTDKTTEMTTSDVAIAHAMAGCRRAILVGHNAAFDLGPGGDEQVGVTMPGPEIQIEKADIHNYLSWIHGNIRFDSTPFLMVLKQLERIYFISNHIENDELLELRLTANFSGNSLENVLGLIAEGLDIEFNYQNGEVHWRRK
jgi:ferric-dicitrate binding protein FerR (iron transport regulator)